MDRLQSPAVSDTSTQRVASPPTRKRKRDDAVQDTKQSKRAAKQRKQNFKNNKNAYDATYDTENGVNLSISHMDPALLSDHIAQRTRRHETSLSPLELSELHIAASDLHDTSAFRLPRTTRALPAFLSHFRGDSALKLDQASQDYGAPHTLVVAGAGLRAAELSRVLRKYQTKEAKVEKLFAKHIKMSEAVESLRKTRVGIGVGTPARISDLIDDGALKTKALARIVVDASHIDVKKRGILDMRETEMPLMKLLCRGEFKQKYGEEGSQALRLLFF